MSITDQLELPAGIDLPDSVREALDDRLLRIAKRLASLASSEGAAGSVTLTGTRARRLITRPQDQAAGTQWVETDTGLTYIVRPTVDGGTGLVWWYQAGTQRGDYTAFQALTLSKFDENLPFHISDKNRTMRWTGTGWTFADHEVIPAGYITGFSADPGTGWHICDGSLVAVLNSDGTTTNTAVEDFTLGGGNEAYPKWTDGAGGRKLAIKPIISGNTGAGTAHHHGVTGLASAATVAVTAGAGNNVVKDGTPVLTGNTDDESAHTHPKGTLVNDALGEPKHYELIAFQRI